MQNPKKFLINFSLNTDSIQALSMPFIAEKYDTKTKELFLSKEQYTGFLESLPPYYNEVPHYFHSKEEHDFIILQPKSRTTKIVLKRKNLYTAIILNKTNFFLAPIQKMTAPIYTKDDEVIYPAFIEAEPKEILDMSGKTFTVYNLKLNHTEMYAENIPYFDLTNPVYTVERLDSNHPFHVRVLENGIEYKGAVARQTVVKSKRTKVGLMWFPRADENNYITKLY